MGELTRVGRAIPWGQAEQAALDRCLTVPGFSSFALPRSSTARLSRTIETEIIPRLMLAHGREPRSAERKGDDTELTSEHVRELTSLVLETEVPVILSHVDRFLAQGISLDSVFLDLFTPTARLLGQMWRDDLLSFADVTIGMSRLQQVLRELSPEFEENGSGARRGQILLARTPGEQHSFGVSMLECFFRRAGWGVWGCEGQSSARLVRCARTEWLDVVGLSLSADVLYGAAATLIAEIRKHSRNPALFVMVGGRYFADHPDHVAEVGADAVASDAPDALRLAASSLGSALARC